MALTPPPISAEAGGFVWTSWYSSLYRYLTTGNAIPWTVIDKAGSSIADLADHSHNVLTSIDGGGTYHLSLAQYSLLSGASGPQSANTVFAGPSAGAPAVPTFRALVASDIPSLSYVSSLSIASANGFAGSSSGGTTPTLTLTTSITGILKGNGTAISAATAGTDYTSPTGTENLSNKTITASTFSGTSVASSGSILSSGTAGIGYSTGAGGAVTQITSRTTGVTINKVTGAITLFTAAGTTTATTFTVTNSTVAATDVVKVCQKSGTNLYNTLVTAVAAGSFNITFYTTGGTASDSPVFNFAVIKGVTA